MDTFGVDVPGTCGSTMAAWIFGAQWVQGFQGLGLRGLVLRVT